MSSRLELRSNTCKVAIKVSPEGKVVIKLFEATRVVRWGRMTNEEGREVKRL
jgi:hypothetical protein